MHDEKLKHFFSRKRSIITVDTTREIKGFIVFIDERRDCSEDQ